MKKEFKINFNLYSYNKDNPNLRIRNDEEIYLLFLKFINDYNLLHSCICDNENGVPPVRTFYFENIDFFKNLKGLNNVQLRKLKKKICALFTFLFLTVNQDTYVKKENVKIDNCPFFEDGSIFIANLHKKMEVFIEGVLFSTRTAAFSCSYSKITKLLSEQSIPFNKQLDSNIYSQLVDYLRTHLFVDDDVAIDKKVCRFNGDVDECYKYDSILFLLDKNKEQSLIKSWFSIEKITNKLKENIEACVKTFKEHEIEYNQICSKNNFAASVSSFNKESNDVDYLCKIALKIKTEFKKIRADLISFYSKINGKYIPNFDKFGKCESNLNECLDAITLFKENKFQILIYVNKSGLLNLIIIHSSNKCFSWDNDNYDCNADNKLVLNATRASIFYEDKIHSINALFDLINLNMLFGSKEKYIVGLPYDFINTESIYDNSFKQNTIAIYENNNSFKAIYLRLTFNRKDIYYDDVSAIYFYDYLSLLIAFSHSYDKQSLYEYSTNKYVDTTMINKIKDLSSSRTTHIFYDDSLFTYTIMDQSHRFVQYNHVINQENDYCQLQSHQYRLYSLWEFSSLCNCLIYGSASMLIHCYLIKEVNKDSNFKTKLGILSSQHRLSKLYAYINLKFSHLVYNSKGRNFPLLDKIFDFIGLIDVENRAKKTFDSNWQYANLNNGRFYSRIGFYFSISSLLISISAFAWASAVFIDCKKTLSQGYEWSDLFASFGSTPKFYFILILALIPLVALFLLIFKEFFANIKITSNVMKFFLHQKTKKGINTKKPNQENSPVPDNKNNRQTNDG